MQTQVNLRSYLQARTKVLVIEPDDQCRQHIIKNLKGESIELMQARTGLEGLERILSQKPALVITALELGDMPALRLLEDLRQATCPEFHTLPFMVMAPHFTATTQSNARRLGVLHCMEYDTHPEIMRFLVQSYCLPVAHSSKEKARLH